MRLIAMASRFAVLFLRAQVGQRKKLGLKAPLRTVTVIGCMGDGVWVHSHVGLCLSSFLVNCYTFHS